MFFVCAIAVLTFGAGSVLAQTADGLTPAVEQDCDDLSGAAFGLCTAYCEAMDCHMYLDGDTPPNASDIACGKVKINFIRITNMGAFPCECPDGVPGQFGCGCDNSINSCDTDLICEDSICIEDEDDGGDF